MPHLSFEYSSGLEDAVDLTAFARRMRDVMDETGVFPFAGIRVRGHKADICVIADEGDYDFLHMFLWLGAGRDIATQKRVAEAVYSAAEAFFSDMTRPLALSFDMGELNADLSIKRHNKVKDVVGTK
ncbi:MAG: 5-carboxymethyl-2-hydroxymuconate isomerase [Pikeienuella sp.]